MADQKDQTPDDPIPWDSLNDNQKNLFVRSLAKARLWRYITFSVGSLILVLQPLANSLFEQRGKDRLLEQQKMEQLSNTATESSKTILESLLRLQAELTFIKGENATLKIENENLRSEIKSIKDQLSQR